MDWDVQQQDQQRALFHPHHTQGIPLPAESPACSEPVHHAAVPFDQPSAQTFFVPPPPPPLFQTNPFYNNYSSQADVGPEFEPRGDTPPFPRDLVDLFPDLRQADPTARTSWADPRAQVSSPDVTSDPEQSSEYDNVPQNVRMRAARPRSRKPARSSNPFYNDPLTPQAEANEALGLKNFLTYSTEPGELPTASSGALGTSCYPDQPGLPFSAAVLTNLGRDLQMIARLEEDEGPEVVVNPFWAHDDERESLVLGNGLSVKPTSTADISAVAGTQFSLSPATVSPPPPQQPPLVIPPPQCFSPEVRWRCKLNRYPLVKQKSCTSVDDATINATINAPVTGTQKLDLPLRSHGGVPDKSQQRASYPLSCRDKSWSGNESWQEHLRPPLLSQHSDVDSFRKSPTPTPSNLPPRCRLKNGRQQSVESRLTMPIPDGALLPSVFEPVPANLYGKPLQEVDPSVRDKTFVVVSKRFRKNYIHRFSASKAFFLFSPWNPIRRLAVFLCTHQYFDYIAMATILLNCIFLAMTEPVEQAEYAFLGIYTTELVVKAIAKGMVLDRLTYLRSPWNWLDFVVILSGYATMTADIGNLSGLRTFRVLRALKTVSIMPGLRTIINALLKSMRQLLEVMTLILFCLSVLALFALQVFMGELRNKCVETWNPLDPRRLSWTTWVNNEDRWMRDETGNFRICGNLTGARKCLEGYSCLPGLGDNPNFGYTNFDTFPWSMLTTFQLITLDFWENVYNMVIAACGPLTIFFFTIVVFFGAFYLINLMLAVVAMSYEEEAGSTMMDDENVLLETDKNLTDYREESTFSFDPGKLQLTLLANGDTGKKAAEDQPISVHQGLEGDKANHVSSTSTGKLPPKDWLWMADSLRKTEAMHDSELVTKAETDPESYKTHTGGLLEVLPLPVSRQPSQDERFDKDGDDSGVQTTDAVSDNSRYYPDSVALKRKVFTSRNVSYNHSSFTESYCSDHQPELPPSDDPKGKVTQLPPGNNTGRETRTGVAPCRLSCEARRLSYKRACDPEKRISLAYDSMISEDSELSNETKFNSKTLLTRLLPAPLTNKYQHANQIETSFLNRSMSTEGLHTSNGQQKSAMNPAFFVSCHSNESHPHDKFNPIDSKAPGTSRAMSWKPSTGQSKPKRLQTARSVSYPDVTTTAYTSWESTDEASCLMTTGKKMASILPTTRSYWPGKLVSPSQPLASLDNEVVAGPKSSNLLLACRGISIQTSVDENEPPPQYMPSKEVQANERSMEEGEVELYVGKTSAGLVSRSPMSSRRERTWNCIVRCRHHLGKIVRSPWMDLMITISILMNTAFLAAEHHGMSPDVKHVLDVGNKVFTSVFTLECLLKIAALGKEYFTNGWNVFDLVIVLASLVDLGLEMVNGLSVLRGMRLMRVLRLAQSWTTMRVLLSIILSSLGALANLTFVLAIVVYIFAVIGMQLFGKNYTPEKFAPDPVPRWNFTDFFHSFMMIFRILCGEWVEPLWDCMRAEAHESPETCFAIFLPALVMGNFLVLNLFLALLLNSFSCEELKSRRQELVDDSKIAEGLKKLRRIAQRKRSTFSGSTDPQNSIGAVTKSKSAPCHLGRRIHRDSHAPVLRHQSLTAIPCPPRRIEYRYQSKDESSRTSLAHHALSRSCTALDLATSRAAAKASRQPILMVSNYDCSTISDGNFTPSDRQPSSRRRSMGRLPSTANLPYDFTTLNASNALPPFHQDRRASYDSQLIQVYEELTANTMFSLAYPPPWNAISTTLESPSIAGSSMPSTIANPKPTAEAFPAKKPTLSGLSSLQPANAGLGKPSSSMSHLVSSVTGPGLSAPVNALVPAQKLNITSCSCFDFTEDKSRYFKAGPLRHLKPETGGWDALIPAVLAARSNHMSLHRRSSEPAPSPREPPDCFPVQCTQRFCCCCHCLENTSCMQSWIRFRQFLLMIVEHSAFEWTVLFLIFGSSITLCFEDIYLDENVQLKVILKWTNLAFSVLFAVEMLAKWLALGLRQSFSSVWTTLDFVIVMVSIVSVAVEEDTNLSALRSLRTLRALRPLRAISRWQGMKIVVNALMFAIPAIFNVLLVCLVFWLVFSILGVQLFGGKFYKCVDEEGERFLTNEVENKLECLSKNYSWENSKITFDHVGHAYLALFQVATFEGWMEIMADAVDVRGIDLQPSHEANLWAYFYFVIFIVCGAFFTLNLFIGVIIDNFNMLKKRYEGGVLEMFLTESQKHYYTAMKKLGRKKPRKVIRRPRNRYHALFYDIAMSRRFEIAIFAMIFANMVVMAVEHYGQSRAVHFVLELFNALFTTMFALESIVKIIGLRHHYFTIPWNLFDFVLVSASVLGLIMEDLLAEFPVSPTLLRVVRVFRLGRVLRLIKAAKGIRKLLFALIVSLPALFNIGALLALITFIYAIIGMALFGHVNQQGALTDLVNFETFGRSMLLLFRLMTGAGWNDILYPLLAQPPNCDPTYKGFPNGNCGNPTLAVMYLVTFIVLSSMIVINMYIAVLLENFNQAHREEELGLGEEDLERFYVKWSRFDPHATQFICLEQLSEFIASLDPPLGVPRPNTAALVTLDIPIASGERLHCLDILHSLTRRVLGDVEDTEHFRKLQEQMDEKFKKQFPNRRQIEIVSSTAKWKQRDIAARIIQRAWKDYLRRKEEQEIRKLEKGDMQTQTSSPDPERSSLRSMLNRVSSFIHTYFGDGATSRRGSPSPSHSVALSRQASLRRPNSNNGPRGSISSCQAGNNSTYLETPAPGGLYPLMSPHSKGSVWSIGTMVVSAQVHGNGQGRGDSPSNLNASWHKRRASHVDTTSTPLVRLHLPGHNPFPTSPTNTRSDVIVKLSRASEESTPT